MKKVIKTEETIITRILLIRKQKVMIDADLAELYGVTTKRLNEQVKRNINRFPPDFMFQLSAEEKNEVVANCDHLKRLKFSSTLPYAFTEHGAVMLASIINSPKAILTNILIVRTFIKMRELLLTNKDILLKLEALEKKDHKQDQDIKLIFAYLKELINPPQEPRKMIGFKK
jgi:predicted XRE-type DNA-binding protein